MTITGPMPTTCQSHRCLMTHRRDGNVIAATEGQYGFMWWESWRVLPGDVVTCDDDEWTVNEPGTVNGITWVPSHWLDIDVPPGFVTMPGYSSDEDRKPLVELARGWAEQWGVKS